MRHFAPIRRRKSSKNSNSQIFCVYLQIKDKLNSKKTDDIDMALPIASIPVLTGEVAQQFEERAQAVYQRYLNRTEEEKKAVSEKYDRGMAIVKKVLENSKLGRR